MDEGKPAKAKWWSRPRPTPGEDGDWHLPAPASASGGAAADSAAPVPAPGPAEDAYDLPLPVDPDQDRAGSPGAPPAQPASVADAGRDAYDLPLPVDPDQDRAGSPGAPPAQPAGVADAGRDAYDLPLPVDPDQDRAGSPGAPPAQPAGVADAGRDAYDLALPADPAQDLAGKPGAAPAQPADVVDAVPDAYRPAPAGDAPRPLHDPDPYSTPPYGEPGPWALAPPVQHPAATPAHGTPTPSPAQHPAHGTPTPPPVQHPAHGTPSPPSAQHPAATPAHGTPTPSPAQQPAGTAHGRPVPSAAQQETYPGAPGAAQQSGPPPAPLASLPESGVAQAYPAPVPHHGAIHPEAPGGPWQRYDPWAGPVGLSGSGGGGEGRPRRGRRAVALGAVLVAIVSGVVGGAIGSYLERNGGTDVELPQAGAESTHRAAGSVAGIAASSLPGVVTIHTKGSSEQGTGTGFVLDDRGHILTNNHVVDPAGSDGQISVTFAGGQSAEADVVGHDSGYDLAVIKVTGVRGLKPLPLGNSESVQVGDPVVAIGAPFDLANTVTSGIISAKDRPITAGGEKGDGTDVSYVDALQTDAPINPGNSGGPLVDSKARVIGINSAIRSADSSSDLDGGQSGSIGLGFAIPINQAKRVAEELINTGKATHPVIGVTLDMDYSGDGARVGTKGNDGGSAVSPGGPGDRAGIEPGDVITEVDGVRVHTGEELIVKIRAHRPKDKLALTVERGGKERQATLVLGSADGN
ncbi:trypsin-like peptidase domain-containing protein [Streptomyces sp. NPDC050264]|uniref:S1C family serine protease n=1 Tax=Streptomyces sp. NPDC050264 TaxID=3155038 RepID=UPI00341C4DDE